MKKITPILVVDEIERCLPFWTGSLGFKKLLEVPHGARLGFVLLAREDLEIMYQSRDSLAKDLPAAKDSVQGASLLYVHVDSLKPLLPALQHAEVVVHPRVTFYGAHEIFVREPGGHIIGFSAMGEKG